MNLFLNKKFLGLIAISGIGISATNCRYNEQTSLNQEDNTSNSQKVSETLEPQESSNGGSGGSSSGNNSNNNIINNYAPKNSNYFNEKVFNDYVATSHAKKSFVKWAKTNEEIKKEYIESDQYKKDLKNFTTKFDQNLPDDADKTRQAKIKWVNSLFAKPLFDKWVKDDQGFMINIRKFILSPDYNIFATKWANIKNKLIKFLWLSDEEIGQKYFQTFKDNLTNESNSYFQKFINYQSVEYNHITGQYFGLDKPEIGFKHMFDKWEDKAIPNSRLEWEQADEGSLFYEKWLAKKEDEFIEEWKKTSDYLEKLKKYLKKDFDEKNFSFQQWQYNRLVRHYYNKWRFSKEGLKVLKDKWIKAKKPMVKKGDYGRIKFSKNKLDESWIKFFAIDSGMSYEEFGGELYKDWIKKKANNKDLYVEFKKSKLFKDQKSVWDNYDKDYDHVAEKWVVTTYPKYSFSDLYKDFHKWLLTSQKGKEAYFKNPQINEDFNFLNWTWMIENGFPEYINATFTGTKTKIALNDFFNWKKDQIFTQKKYDENYNGQFKKDFKEWLHQNSWKKTIYFNSKDSSADYENWKKNTSSHRSEETYKDLLKYEWSLPYKDYYNFILKTSGDKKFLTAASIWPTTDKKPPALLEKLKDWSDDKPSLFNIFYNLAESDFLYNKWQADYQRTTSSSYTENYFRSNQENIDYQKWIILEYLRAKESDDEFKIYMDATLDEKAYKNNDFAIFDNNYQKWLEDFKNYDYDKFFKIYKSKERSKKDMALYKWENDLPRNDFSKELTIFHTSDTQGHVKEDYEKVMGFAKISTIIKDAKKNDNSENKDSILLFDGGDFLGGSSYATLTKGAGIIPILNEVGYDAAALGVHEFDYGSKVLKELMIKSRFPYLSANTKWLKDDSIDFPDYKIFNKNGIKIGVFGLTTPQKNPTTNSQRMTNFAFEDTILKAKEVVSKLKSQNVDLIFCLGHLGNNKYAKGLKGIKSNALRSSDVIKAVPGINVFIDGYSHKLLEEPYKVEDTLILQAGFKTQSLGKLRIKIDKDKKVHTTYEVITKDKVKNVKKDQKILELIKSNIESEKVKALENEIIGHNPYPTLYGEYVEEKQSYGDILYKAHIGQLIAAAMLEASANADFALQNAGGIRADLNGSYLKKGFNKIAAANITKKDILSILPYGNNVATIEVTGAELKAAIQKSFINGWEYGDLGSLPRIAGFKAEVTIDGKIAKLKKEDGTLINDKKVYKLATSDFLVVGGHYYEMFKDKKVIKAKKVTLADALINYIKKYPVKFNDDGTIDTTKENWYTKTEIKNYQDRNVTLTS